MEKMEKRRSTWKKEDSSLWWTSTPSSCAISAVQEKKQEKKRRRRRFGMATSDHLVNCHLPYIVLVLAMTKYIKEKSEEKKSKKRRKRRKRDYSIKWPPHNLLYICNVMEKWRWEKKRNMEYKKRKNTAAEDTLAFLCTWYCTERRRRRKTLYSLLLYMAREHHHQVHLMYKFFKNLVWRKDQLPVCMRHYKDSTKNLGKQVPSYAFLVRKFGRRGNSWKKEHPLWALCISHNNKFEWRKLVRNKE